MASDWIRMRRGLRHNPKVIAMARFLADDPKFREWLSENGGVTRHESVTVAFVTRVTVASLLDVWSSLNESVRNDGEMPFMGLLDIDEIAEIPGFGRAMKHVGWVEETQAGGLMFPNFGEHNTPAKERGGGAKSDAQRAREYRERKRAEKERHGVTSRHAIEEKRREDKKCTPQTPHWSGEKPKTDLSQLASRIATLVPEWSPHFSHIERVNLVDNLGKWEGLTESDWRALEAWYADDTEASKFRAGKAKLLESPDEEVGKARRAGFSASAPKPKRKLAAPEGWQAVYAEIDPNPLHVDGEYCAPEWERLSPSEQSEVAAKMAAIGSGSTQDAHNTPSKVETADKQ